MGHPRHWTLRGKLALVATPFVVLALLSIALALWVSWQLDGGAAAVNEAGRMRMQTYRMSLAIGTGARDTLPAQAAEFERSLALLRDGDFERPLFVPSDEAVRQQLVVVENDWQRFRRDWITGTPAAVDTLPAHAAAFVADIDALVAGIERHMSRWTAMLHLLQLAMMGFAVVGSGVLLYAGYLFVLEPVSRLQFATERVQRAIWRSMPATSVSMSATNAAACAGRPSPAAGAAVIQSRRKRCQASSTTTNCRRAASSHGTNSGRS